MMRVVTTATPSVVFENTMSHDGQYLFGEKLPSCTLFNFSISAVSINNGESEPAFITGGFDEGMLISMPACILSKLDTMLISINLNNSDPSQCFINDIMVYFKATGTPLADLEIQVHNINHDIMSPFVLNFQLPTTLCPYQYVKYMIVIRELPSENIITFGLFSHRGSGIVMQSITSGLNRDQNYSVMVMVNTTVGSSDATAYFGKRTNSGEVSIKDMHVFL